MSEQGDTFRNDDRAAETCLLLQIPTHGWVLCRGSPSMKKQRPCHWPLWPPALLSGIPSNKSDSRRKMAALTRTQGTAAEEVGAPSRQRGRAQGHPGGQRTLAASLQPPDYPSWTPLTRSTGLLPFPWSSLSPQLRASVHRVSLPIVPFAPHSMWASPHFLLVSDGCQVLEVPRCGLIPTSHALIVSGYIQGGFPQDCKLCKDKTLHSLSACVGGRRGQECITVSVNMTSVKS